MQLTKNSCWGNPRQNVTYTSINITIKWIIFSPLEIKIYFCGLWEEQWREEKKFVTLNVIIESAIFVAIFIQEAECIGISKILKLNEAVHAISRKQEIMHHVKEVSKLYIKTLVTFVVRF